MSEKKPAVYLCKGCGISEAVDVDALETVAKTEFKIGRCVKHAALCSDDGLAAIKSDVESGNVNRMVIAACSHRVMTDKFQFGAAPVVRASLREQVAWSQSAKTEHTQMLAADQIRMGVTQLNRTETPAPSVVQEFSRTVMVVGGGITGLTSAREAAKAGYPVLLVEKTDRLGGWATKWSGRMPHRPPYRDVQPNDMSKLVATVQADKQITVKTNTLISRTAGQPGAFAVTLSQAGQETTEKVGAIVVATGWRPYDASKLGHLGYAAHPTS